MKPRDHVLSTTRTELRPFVDEDGPELFHLFRDPKVRGYLLDDVLVSPGWVQNEIEASEARFARGSAGLWSVRLPERRDIIGFAGFREFFDPPQLNLLYGFLPAYWGRGLATEVTTRVSDFAFRELGFDEITATTDLPNRASTGVLRHLGMDLVRTDADGTTWYALDRDAWVARAAGAAE